MPLRVMDPPTFYSLPILPAAAFQDHNGSTQHLIRGQCVSVRGGWAQVEEIRGTLENVFLEVWWLCNSREVQRRIGFDASQAAGPSELIMLMGQTDCIPLSEVKGLADIWHFDDNDIAILWIPPRPLVLSIPLNQIAVRFKLFVFAECMDICKEEKGLAPYDGTNLVSHILRIASRRGHHHGKAQNTKLQSESTNQVADPRPWLTSGTLNIAIYCAMLYGLRIQDLPEEWESICLGWTDRERQQYSASLLSYFKTRRSGGYRCHSCGKNPSILPAYPAPYSNTSNLLRGSKFSVAMARKVDNLYAMPVGYSEILTMNWKLLKQWYPFFK
ncbi:hypothetical protein C8J56DRAFT_1118774 [Mycena floridula]|nr:hypothetical protein C8J56DRAFT_1118774 [Mycena floridula]